jgi:hypothetical protein
MATNDDILQVLHRIQSDIVTIKSDIATTGTSTT